MRNHDERDVGPADHRIRALTQAKRRTDFQFADHGAFGRRPRCRRTLPPIARCRAPGDHQRYTARRVLMHGEVVPVFNVALSQAGREANVEPLYPLLRKRTRPQICDVPHGRPDRGSRRRGKLLIPSRDQPDGLAHTGALNGQTANTQR